MKKRFLEALVTGLFLLTLTGMAQAALTTIGTESCATAAEKSS